MINLKPTIVNALKTVHDNVTECYPDNFKTLPCITYEEERNEPHTITHLGERRATIAYKVDIWSTQSTSTLKTQINATISQLGFTRVFCQDVKDNHYKHTIMRFEGVYDYDNKKIFKK